jgi:ABC-type glycerol-3-phosphate transport system substrate-binding protein
MDAYQFEYDTIWKYYVRPNGEQVGALFADDPMSPGIVANWEIQSWIEYAYPTWNEAFNWDMAAIPSMNGLINAQADFDIFTITKSSKHPKEAWEVAKWLIAPEQMKRLAPSYGFTPSRKSLAASWIEEKKALYPNVDFQVMIDAMAYADFPINHEGWTPAFNQVVDAFTYVEQSILASKDANVTDLLTAAQEEVQGYLNDYWAAHQ